MCRERIRMQAAGKLQIAPDVEYDFTSDDLQDLGEIGRGAYGAVNKMIFRRTNTVMAGEWHLVARSGLISMSAVFDKYDVSILHHASETYSIDRRREGAETIIDGSWSGDEI